MFLRYYIHGDVFGITHQCVIRRERAKHKKMNQVYILRLKKYFKFPTFYFAGILTLIYTHNKETIKIYYVIDGVT